MPLVYKKEPKDVSQIVDSQLEKIKTAQGFRTPTLASISFRTSSSQIEHTSAVPVYYLGLDGLKSRQDLSTAEHKGWRYIITHQNKGVASADAFIDEEGTAAFSHINEGPLVEGLVKALKIANVERVIQEREFEARILMVPALYVAALWLYDTTGKQDYVIPFEPTSDPLRANVLIKAQDLMRTLYKLARSHSE